MSYLEGPIPSDWGALKKQLRAERAARHAAEAKLKSYVTEIEILKSAAKNTSWNESFEETLAREIAKIGTWNVRAAITRAYRTAIEAVIRKYRRRVSGEMQQDVQQATNETAYELLSLLVSAELNEEPRGPPIRWSRRVILDRLQRLDHPRTLEMVHAAMAATGHPEDAESIYLEMIKARSMVPTEGAIKGWMTKNGGVLGELGLVKIERRDRGLKQKDVISDIALTKEGREFMRQVERSAIRLIVDFSATRDQQNREENER